VITISNDELQSACVDGNESNSYAMLWFWTLKGFRKCIFLKSDLLVKTNCDELFKHEEVSGFKDVTDKAQFDPSIFVFRPNFKTYEQLLDVARSSDTGNFNTYLFTAAVYAF